MASRRLIRRRPVPEPQRFDCLCGRCLTREILTSKDELERWAREHRCPPEVSHA